jgi:hypothetical protein
LVRFEQTKLFKNVLFGRAQAQPNALAADFTNMLISIRRGSAGAKRQGPKASIDKFGFRGRQLTSTLADQYSGLVIHVFLLSSLFESVDRAQSFQQKFLATERRTKKRGAAGRHSVSLANRPALTNGGISILVGTSRGGDGAKCFSM